VPSAHDRGQVGQAHRPPRYSLSVHHVPFGFPRSVSSDSEPPNPDVFQLTKSSVNIANANVFGLSEELDLVRDNRYNNALVIFFVPYILFEIPSNVILKYLKPRVWLSICMFGFGLGTLCHAGTSFHKYHR
jgi:hypothetical protein